MRFYPKNSPQAAARIIALALTVDGNVNIFEERSLEHLDFERKLGIDPGEFTEIVKTLCEDMSHVGHPKTFGNHNERMLSLLMDDISDDLLRRKVIRLCFAVILADEHLADNEIAFLALLLGQWHPRAATQRQPV